MLRYREIKFGLFTFALGLAAVSFFRFYSAEPQEISIDLPEVQSGSIFFITPIRGECIPASGSHFTYDWPKIKKCQKEVGHNQPPLNEHE